MEQKKLKRAVIKEELIAITGNYIDAIILNQLIYWSERVRDFDKFIEQEKMVAERHGEKVNIDLTCGWIYKTADELSEETMLGLSKSNMRQHLKKLLSLDFIQERENPKYRWDKTKQYRVNMANIQIALQKLGYCLEGYPLVLNQNIEVLPDDIRGSKSELQGSKSELHSSKTEQQYQRLQTENTTEISLKEKKKEKTTEAKNAKKSFDEIIEDYTENEKLRHLLKEHLKVRKAKKALVDTAVETSLKHLSKIGRTDEEKIRIVEKSVMHCWTGFFELKDDEKPNQTSYSIDKWEQDTKNIWDQISV